MNQETEECPNCLNTFTLKRLNQKYCSDNCRIQKNNARSRAFRELTKTTNQILLKNRNILAALEGKQLSEIELKIKGFEFGYVTNFKTNKTNQTKLFCYDYGYSFNKSGGKNLISIFKI